MLNFSSEQLRRRRRFVGRRTRALHGPVMSHDDNEDNGILFVFLRFFIWLPTFLAHSPSFSFANLSTNLQRNKRIIFGFTHLILVVNRNKFVRKCLLPPFVILTPHWIYHRLVNINIANHSNLSLIRHISNDVHKYFSKTTIFDKHLKISSQAFLCLLVLNHGLSCDGVGEFHVLWSIRSSVIAFSSTSTLDSFSMPLQASVRTGDCTWLIGRGTDDCAASGTRAATMEVILLRDLMLMRVFDLRSTIIFWSGLFVVFLLRTDG